MSTISYIKRLDNNSVILELYVQPGAKHTMIVGVHDGALKIKVNKEPVDGRANKEVLMFLHKLIGGKIKQFSLVSGEKSRYKRVLITDIGLDNLSKLEDIFNGTN